MLTNVCPHCGKDRGDAGNNCPHCKAEVEKHDAARPRTSRMLIIISVCFFAVSVLATWAVPNYLRRHVDICFVRCNSNEEDIGTALEMYATDHKDMYPAQLQDLVPKYLKSIPTCPEAHKDTYSSTYACSKTMKDYTFTCKGENHSCHAIGDFPQYNSRQGLVNGY